MHTCEKNLVTCNNCTFTSKTETDLIKHTQQYNIMHSNIDYDEHLEEFNYKIFALKEIGLVLFGLQDLADEDQ